MDGFLIGIISFFGGWIVDRIIIACRRRSAKNDNNSSDNHDEEKNENTKNSITEVKQEIKQNEQKIETDQDKQMKFYDEIGQKLDFLQHNAKQALQASKALNDKLLISGEDEINNY